MPLVVLAAAAAALLALAAVAKLRRPAPTARALLELAAIAGWRPRPVHALRAARGLGAAELAIVGLVVAPGVPAALGEGLLGSAYAGFTVVVLLQLRAARAGGTAADCGCFGTDAPLGAVHAVLDAAGALAAAVTAADGAARPLAVALAPTDLRAATLLTLSLIVAGLARAAMTALPAQRGQLRASARLRAAQA